ncbi:MATE family efflux transporter [Acholeplasma granularum]|uniref:MATE family efflux transporter n=1 Tax=Acholeplasma granularum TaxID=264635 RepID=UPI00046F9B41|nr:MATE family efflux transporter [Acholeplasma granularum]
MKPKSNKRELILYGNIYKVILILALPVILNNVILGLYQIIDSFFSESLGDGGLSAVSFTAPIIGILNAVGAALAVATTSLVARYIGKSEILNARKTMAQVLLITSTVSVVISFLGIIFSYQIVHTLNASDQYIDLANLYLKYNLIGLPLKFIGDIYFSYKSARGENVHTMLTSLTSMLIKIILSIILVHQMKLGVLGLGLATIMSYSIIVIVGIIDMFVVHTEFKIKISDFKVAKNLLIPFLIMIIPLLIEKTSLNFSHVVVNYFITQFEPSVIAAYGLTNKINSLFFIIPTSIGTALIAILAQNLTAGHHTRNNKAIKIGLLLGISFSAFAITFLYIFQIPIINLFTKDPETIRHTINAMNTYSHTVFAWAIMQIAIAVFYASGHGFVPIIISFSRLLIFRIPILYVLLEFTNLGEYSIWYCMLIANILAAILSIVLMLRIKWQKTPKYLL